MGHKLNFLYSMSKPWRRTNINDYHKNISIKRVPHNTLYATIERGCERCNQTILWMKILLKRKNMPMYFLGWNRHDEDRSSKMGSGEADEGQNSVWIHPWAYDECIISTDVRVCGSCENDGTTPLKACRSEPKDGIYPIWGILAPKQTTSMTHILSAYKFHATFC
jgi:hypothetical protein